MGFYLITTLHVIVCAFLIIVVLLQSGQSADIAAAFGGMGSQTAFGARTAGNILTKATTWAAVLFMVTSITLSIMAQRRTHSSGSVLEGARPAATKPAPAQKPAPEPQPATPSR
jgi:preprotein translocase subunit SecG